MTKHRLPASWLRLQGVRALLSIPDWFFRTGTQEEILSTPDARVSGFAQSEGESKVHPNLIRTEQLSSTCQILFIVSGYSYVNAGQG